MDKLKVGIIAHGELGRYYVSIVHRRIKNADLVAVSSTSESELDFAKLELGIKQVYKDYQNLLSLHELDAVFVISQPDQHAHHILDALDANLNVFAENPLSLNVDDGNKVILAADKVRSQTAAVSLVRRYDPSFRQAYEQMKQGAIGDPILVRSLTAQPELKPKELKRSKLHNGGIFLDFNYHDIDMTRWFLDEEFEEVYALGSAYKLKAYADIDEADFVQSACKLSRDKMAHISASRLAVQGMNTYTEIVGTEGSLIIGRPSAHNRVEILDKHGLRKELIENRFERFREAFELQIQDFVGSILEGKKLRITLKDALEATRVAVAMTKSFVLEKPVKIER